MNIDSRTMRAIVIKVLLDNKAVYFSNLYFLRYGLFDPLGFRIVLATQILYALPAAALVLTLLLRLAGPLAAGVWLNAAFLLAIMWRLGLRVGL